MKTGTDNKSIPLATGWHYITHTVPREFFLWDKTYFSLLFHPHMVLLIPLQTSTIRVLIITGVKMIKRKLVSTMLQKATGATTMPEKWHLCCDQVGDKKALSAKVKGLKEGHALNNCIGLEGEREKRSHYHPGFYKHLIWQQ